MHVDPRTRVSLLSRPKRLRSSVRIKWRVDIDKIDAGCGEFAQLIQIITAVDDARVDERGRLCRHFFSTVPKVGLLVNAPSMLWRADGAGLDCFPTLGDYAVSRFLDHLFK